jgi:hypothetical protein
MPAHSKVFEVMNNNPARPASDRSLWIVATGLVLVSVALWFLPGQKPNAIFGRSNYWQFYAALGVSAVALFALVIALLPKHRRRPVGFRLVAVGMSLVLALLMAELVAWILPVRSHMDNPFYLVAKLGGLSQSDDLPYERPPHISWTGSSRGDLALANDDEDPHAQSVTFQTDGDGFRNSRDLSQADLITIGDSFTEAGNVPEESTFTSLLGKRLQLSARNLGRSGYSTPTEWIVFQKYGTKTRPKVVVWQIAESNDLSDVDDYERWKQLGRPNYFDFNASAKPSRQAAWRARSVSWRLFDLLRRRDLNPWPFTGWFKLTDGREERIRFKGSMGLGSPARGHPAWPQFSAPLIEAAAYCRSNDIRLLIVHIPDKYRVLGPSCRFAPEIEQAALQQPGLPEEISMAACLKELCASAGINYVDTTSALRQQANAGLLVYQPFDTHLSALGHQVVAEQIAEALKQAP